MKCLIVRFYFKLFYFLGIFFVFNKILDKKAYMKFLRVLNRSAKRGVGRSYLELEIMPYYKIDKDDNILLIGSMPYNFHYSYYYLENKVYIIEPNEKEEKFKGRGTFINDYIENIDTYISNNISLCQFNGVYGWGLNESENLKIAVNKIYNILDKNGIVIFGHNSKTHNPLDIEDKYEEFFSIFSNEENEVLPKIFLENELDQTFIGYLKP